MRRLSMRAAVTACALLTWASVIAGAEVELRVVPAGERMVRVCVSPLVAGKMTLPADGPMLEPRARAGARAWPEPLLVLTSGAQAATKGQLKVDARFDGQTAIVSIAGEQSAARQELRIDCASGAVEFSGLDQPVYGLGQGGPQFDRRGNEEPMLSDHGAYKLKTHGGRIPIPWLMGKGWGLFVNAPEGGFDLRGRERGKFIPRKGAGLPLDIFVALADKPEDLLRSYVDLTGHASMPPIWALGYQQSHRTIQSWDEVLGIAKTFREKKLPCDALIYLGTGWCPSGWNTGHGSFEFNKPVFPDPAANLAALRALNFQVVLHAVYPPRNLHGSVNDLVDEANAATAGWYWDKHRAVEKLGVAGWWPDAGEELPLASRMARIRMYWEGPQQDYPDVRPYALHRAGVAGMQRYGGWVWSGDVNATWQTLRNHVAIGLNTGLSGLPYWGSDTGGFYPTKELTGEYYVRWFQFSAFCPLFRSHGRPSHTRLPWGWNTGEYGPTEMDGAPKDAELPDPAELHNDKVEPICRKYLELRYRMLPHIYSLAWQAHEMGLPLMRPLWMYYGDDAEAAAREDEYLWGRDILVAPVMEKGATTRNLYLPRGTWWDFWTEQKVEGGRWIERPVDLETIPLYVRAGAIIPMGPVKQYALEKIDGPLTVKVYPGADGQFELFEDDGVSFAFEKGGAMRTMCRWNDAAGRLDLALAEGSAKRGLPRTVELRVVGQEAKTMRFDGQKVDVR